MAEPSGDIAANVFLVFILAASLVIVLIHLCVAAVLKPPRPLAERSVLGRHVVGLAKIALGFLGFFGGLLLTTIIAMGNDHWGSSDGMYQLMGQLWSMLLTLVAFVAYGYWFWIAIDLIRLGPSRRLAAVNWWYKTRLEGLVGVRWVERMVRGIARGVVDGPWWAILLTFYLAPVVLIYAVWQLVSQAILAVS
ncbi:hypothetical protein [Microbacterium sp. NPDC055665]